MDSIPSKKPDNLSEQINNLDISIREFLSCIGKLSNDLFLKRMDNWDWAPRDVIAHLIGWNLYTIEGCQMIQKGETPFFFIDPGQDFSKVNAMLVQKYSSKKKNRLTDQIQTSAEKLKEFILTINPTDWETDFGVNYKDGTVTMKNMIDALIYDYDTHKSQIEERTTNVNS